jgi:hypothetical protein
MPVLDEDSVAPVRLGFVPSLTHPLRDRLAGSLRRSEREDASSVAGAGPQQKVITRSLWKTPCTASKQQRSRLTSSALKPDKVVSICKTIFLQGTALAKSHFRKDAFWFTKGVLR